MRKIHTFFLLFLLIGIVGFSSCTHKSKKSGNLIDYVPENTAVVLEISDWITFKNDVRNNSLLKKIKDSDYSKFFAENEVFLDAFQPDSESLLTLQEQKNNTPVFTFITKQTANQFVLDSILNKTAETLKIDTHVLDRIEVDKKLIFTTIIDSVFIASSSQETLMHVLEGKTEKTTAFKKTTQLPATDGFTAYFKGNHIKTSDSAVVNFTTWNALDILIAPESVTAHGISLPTDTIPQLLKVFSDQIPQQNHAAEIIPMNAKTALSFTFNDSEKLQQRLREFRGDTTPPELTGIVDSAGEIGEFKLSESAAVFIKSIDETITSDGLARFVSTDGTFRDVEIKKFSEATLFKDLFAPFIEFDTANYVFQLDDFFVFTETEKTAQEIIGAFLNNSTLQHAAYYKESTQDLSSASSLLFYGMQGEFATYLSTLSNLNMLSGLEQIDLSEYPLFALQYSYDRNFAHIALSCRVFGGGSTKTISKGISEKFHVTLKNDILGDPQIFESNGSNVVVQDVNNTLHFISENGKELWTKDLNAPIVGKISQVDLFKNGNQQLAFTTKNSLYILDRNGKNVGPFPLKFKDEISQPLAVFDYDGTHEYRFVITQGKEVLMYDKNAKIVTGFGFRKASSEIVQSPVHIRMGNKDYIVIAEQNGTLNILNRQGRTRVNVSKKFEFSEIPITYEGTKFVVITKNNIKESISDRGVVESVNPGVGDAYWFSILNGVKATLDDNLLRINGKLAELPIGVYSEPQLFSISRNVYTAVTEIQEKKVFLFDENARPVEGFPVFGSSNASLGTRSSRSNYLVVKGDSNGIIVYEIQ